MTSKNSTALLNTLLIIGVMIGTSIAGYALNSVAAVHGDLGNHDKRLEYIERTRYTAEDAMRASAIQTAEIRSYLKELHRNVEEVAIDVAVIKVKITNIESNLSGG